MKKLDKFLGERKLLFAKADELKEKMGVAAGALSPFGLLNDKTGEVEVFIDHEVYHAAVVHFHPNRNTASLVLTGKMFLRFLGGIENTVKNSRLVTRDRTYTFPVLLLSLQPQPSLLLF